jgi:hypothetical protein
MSLALNLIRLVNAGKDEAIFSLVLNFFLIKTLSVAELASSELIQFCFHFL